MQNNEDECFYCKRKFGSIISINRNTGKPNLVEKTYDHIIPKAKGGNNYYKNLIPCCKQCNKLKMYYTPRELLDVIRVSLANKDAQQGIIKGKGVSGVIIQFKHSMLVTIMESLKQLIDEGYTS